MCSKTTFLTQKLDKKRTVKTAKMSRVLTEKLNFVGHMSYIIYQHSELKLYT